MRKVKVKVFPQQAEVAEGVPDRLRPRIFLTFGTIRVVGRQPYAPAAFTPEEIPGTHFQRLSRPQGTWFCRGNDGKKIPSDTTGNRSRDRPTSSAVPYPLRHPRPHINHTTGRNNTDETIYIIIYWLHIAYTGEYLARLSKHKFHNDSALWTCTCLV